ncbi:MAG TPA: methylmalonyl Co-A mutase-associated GTPase MeaB [Gemmatimonadales bacterium]|jgi:LAO/AO transport system kinase
MDLDLLVRRFEEGQVSALARAISLVENARPGYEELLSRLHPGVGRAHRIGITGPPGAGKSTLVELLVQAYRAAGETIGVVAVDPTSPFTGGALLGDRIRMEAVALDPGVFIRSMATRGGVGGLATTTREVCDVFDAFGFQRIVIETVGVGQSELAIAASADTTALVLVPESGDGVQAMKAGVMEIADVYVVNKGDRIGADRLIQEVEVMLGIRRGNAYRHVGAHHSARELRVAVDRSDAGGDGAWAPPVLKTAAAKREGIAELVEALNAHAEYLKSSGLLTVVRRERLARHTREVVDRRLSHLVWQERDGEQQLAAALEDVVEGRVSPYRVAHDIVADLTGGTQHDAA